MSATAAPPWDPSTGRVLNVAVFTIAAWLHSGRCRRGVPSPRGTALLAVGLQLYTNFWSSAPRS
eukprot:7901263-Alexandrium_andersonii.AAC.1